MVRSNLLITFFALGIQCFCNLAVSQEVLNILSAPSVNPRVSTSLPVRVFDPVGVPRCSALASSGQPVVIVESKEGSNPDDPSSRAHYSYRFSLKTPSELLKADAITITCSSSSGITRSTVVRVNKGSAPRIIVSSFHQASRRKLSIRVTDRDADLNGAQALRVTTDEGNVIEVEQGRRAGKPVGTFVRQLKFPKGIRSLVIEARDLAGNVTRRRVRSGVTLSAWLQDSAAYGVSRAAEYDAAFSAFRVLGGERNNLCDTDQSEYLASLINTSRTRVVRIPRGIYCVHNTITIQRGAVEILPDGGKGSVVITVAPKFGVAPAATWLTPIFYSGAPLGDVQIRDLIFIGNRNPSAKGEDGNFSGVFDMMVSNSRFLNNTIIRFESGIHVRSSASFAASNNLIQGNSVFESGNLPIVLHGSNGSSVLHQAGDRLPGTCAVINVNNVIQDNFLRDNEQGIKLYCSREARVYDNIVLRTAIAAIRLELSDDNDIAGNFLSESLRGIWVYAFSSRNSFTENTIVDNNPRRLPFSPDCWAPQKSISEAYFERVHPWYYPIERREAGNPLFLAYQCQFTGFHLELRMGTSRNVIQSNYIGSFREGIDGTTGDIFVSYFPIMIGNNALFLSKGNRILNNFFLNGSESRFLLQGLGTQFVGNVSVPVGPSIKSGGSSRFLKAPKEYSPRAASVICSASTKHNICAKYHSQDRAFYDVCMAGVAELCDPYKNDETRYLDCMSSAPKDCVGSQCDRTAHRYCSVCNRDSTCEPEQGETPQNCPFDCPLKGLGAVGSRAHQDRCEAGLTPIEPVYSPTSGCSNVYDGSFFCARVTESAPLQADPMPENPLCWGVQ